MPNGVQTDDPLSKIFAPDFGNPQPAQAPFQTQSAAQTPAQTQTTPPKPPEDLSGLNKMFSPDFGKTDTKTSDSGEFEPEQWGEYALSGHPKLQQAYRQITLAAADAFGIKVPDNHPARLSFADA